MSGWLSLWGLAALTLGGLGLLLAFLVGSRSLTLTLAALGGGAGLWGLFGTRQDLKTPDLVWLGLGGSLSGLVLCLALFSPGLLNGRWTREPALAISTDPGQFVRVPRDQPRHKGKPLAAEESVDAGSEAIRLEDVVFRLESVTIGPLAGRGVKDYVQVHCRIHNAGQGRIVNFQGFGTQMNQPVLTDVAGRFYPLLEYRPGTENGQGPPVFGDPSGPMMVPVLPNARRDSLLVFELPPSGGEEMHLAIPASAWGSQGTCRFRIAGAFEASTPAAGKK